MITIEQVNKSISKYEVEINKKPKDKMETLYKQLDISLSEICLYQEWKSIAQIENKIDFDTAMMLYNKLSTWSSATLAERIVLTQVMAAIYKP